MKADEHDAWIGELMLMDVWPKQVRGVARHTVCGRIMLIEIAEGLIKPPHHPSHDWCFYCDAPARLSTIGTEHWNGGIATRIWNGGW